MPAPTRIYRITIGDSDRLVRAVSPAAALMHVARDISRTQIASQEDLVECLEDGIRVETAGEAPAARVTDFAPDPLPGAPDAAGVELVDHDPAGAAPGER